MSAPKLTVREVVAVLRETWCGGNYLDQHTAPRVHAILARWDAEVEVEEREEHRRALEAAESEAVEPW